MNKIIIILLSCFASTLMSDAQSVVGAEYYWDHDPGVGLATALVVTMPGSSINESFNIPTTGLSQGQHKLVVRTFDSDGHWSPAFSKEVLVHKFSETEVFWDSDPGEGNGITLPLNSTSGDVTNSYSVSTTGMKEGWHTLYTRTRGYGNAWSPPVSEPVYIVNDIIAAEYFWNHDPGVGNGIALEVDNPSSNITITDDVSTVGLDTTVDIHYLVVRTMAMNDAWSVMVDTALFLGPVGIEVLKNGGITSAIYPNPSNGPVTISMFQLSGENISVWMENMSGQKVEEIYNGVFTNRKDITRDFSSIAPGVYLIRFKTEKYEWSQKVIIGD